MAIFKTAQQSIPLKFARRLIGFCTLLWVAILFSPNLLAFPYQIQIGDKSVYSETPIAPEIKTVLIRSDALLRQSPIFSGGYGKAIYLTNGGWRWRLLTVPASSDAFGLTRPWIETIAINQSDVAADKVFSKATNGRTRTLSGTIAHEQAHGLLRGHFGIKLLFSPTWKVEGYCDHIAQNGSLNDQQAEVLEKINPGHPALTYYYGRKRVAAILASNGGSVNQLFEE
jgi:hypothetical protein